MEKHDNYAIASANARKLFLSYDQDALIRKLNLRYDDAWLYTRFFDRDYRISRLTGNMERLEGAAWQSANGFHEVLTLMDLLCDSREDRHLSGRIRNMLDFGHQFHQTLLEESRDPFAEKIQENPAAEKSERERMRASTSLCFRNSLSPCSSGRETRSLRPGCGFCGTRMPCNI